MQTHATMNQEEIDVISYYVTCLDSMLLFLDQKGVAALATLPSLDQLRGKIIGLLQAPATKVAGVLQAPAGQLARVFGAYAAKDAA